MAGSRFAAVALIFFFVLQSFSFAKAPQSSQTAHEDAMIREVLELERDSKEAAMRNDASFSARMLGEDYIAIGPLGEIITKEESVALRHGSSLHYDSMDISEIAVRIYGDTAIVTARADVKGTNVGEDFSGPYRFTRVWVKRNGEWHTVSYQATVTK